MQIKLGFFMNTDQTIQDVIIKEFKPRETIVAEGSLNDRFFVILKGNVEILQNNKSIRVLKDGDVFGIENFYLNRSYTTCATSITTSRVASYHTNMIKDIIYDRPQLIQQILASLMRQLEQTTQIAEENIPLENIVDLNDRIYQDGEKIIEEGSEGSDIFRLLKSQHGLRVTIKGREIGTITKPGEYFGEMSAILREKRSATVSSIGKSVVQVFSSDNLQSILEAYPKLAKKIIDTLAQRLFEANKKLSTKYPADLL